MKKCFKIFVFIVIIIVIILIFNFFIKTNYKIQQTGNNKSIKEIEQYILNIASYKANVKISIISNKNTNFYEFEQVVSGQSYSRQLVLSPSSLAGMEIIYEDGTITLKNTKYNLSRIYNNNPYVSTNSLFLTSFIEGYRNAETKEIVEIDGKIQMSFLSKINRYNYRQILYIDKSNLEPKKLQVYDINNELKVNRIYNEIELNI